MDSPNQVLSPLQPKPQRTRKGPKERHMKTGFPQDLPTACSATWTGRDSTRAQRASEHSFTGTPTQPSEAATTASHPEHSNESRCPTNTTGYLDYALSVPQTSPQLNRIKWICLSSYRGPSSDEVLNLTSAVASACPALDVVWLNLVSEDGSTTEEPLSFEVFRPLLECHAVTEFVVGQEMPLWLAEIAKGWPGLKVLLLTPDPNFPDSNVTSEQGLDNLDLGAHSAKTAQPHQLGVVPRRSTSSPTWRPTWPHHINSKNCS